MAITKNVCSWILKGVCSTSGNIMTFWKTNFNMPVPFLFGGSATKDAGWMAARYGNIGGTFISLSAFYPGYEVALADGIWRWEVSDGSCLNGLACVKLFWWRDATCLTGIGGTTCVNLNSSPGTSCWRFTEALTNIGIAGWEICSNTTYCTEMEATTVSGDDVSIGICDVYIYPTSTPSTTQCSGSLKGAVWVEGNNLNYINANCWEHSMTGDSQGGAGANTQGAIWIDNFCYLHWVGADCNDYRAKWRICQFCSSFTAGAPANPAPGASYKGALWVDGQFGLTHLAYIGCDGNKYLAGAGEYPYVAP